MFSTAREHLRAWVTREQDALSLSRFRRVFALIWLAYDALDLAFSGTAVCANWIVTTTQGAPAGLMALQAGLIACQLALFLGFQVTAMALCAVALRALEAFGFFRLNDFLYYIVTAALLVFARPTQIDGGQARIPSWVRDALIAQAGWIYVATAVLKMNPAFLSGEHFLVRHGYLSEILHWPYPAFVRPWLLSLPFNAALARLTVASELTLGALLLSRRGRRLAILLAIGIHVFAALAVNVFFFGASMIAQVCLLFPRDEGSPPAAASDQGSPAWAQT